MWKMETETHLARTIETVGKDARYDSQVKKLLANKAILAWVLKTCTEEFQGYSPNQIAECIEGTPDVAAKAVHAIDPDADENLLESDHSIEGTNTEDVSLKEQKVYYDIRFNARVPGDAESIQLIINIEAQMKLSPGYSIERRAIYYCCRLISAQYGSVFTHSEYGKIRKVYSIWFCMNSDKEQCNTIKKISLSETPLYGEPERGGRDVDLLQAVMVNLGDADSLVDSQILRLMNVLLSAQMSAQEKKEIMQEEFHIAMTAKLEREVSEMCNLSVGVYNEGLEEGRKEGRVEGILGSIEFLRELEVEDSRIVDKIMRKYQLTREEAERYVYPQARS